MSEIVYPLSDVEMVYDYKRHIYVLTPEYINQEFGINLAEVLEFTDMTNPADAPIIWLRRVSKYVYEKIYSTSSDRNLKEFCLAKDGYWRRFIKDWLGEMALYMLNNGDVGLQAGVNFNTNTSNKLYENRGDRLYPPLMLQSMWSSGVLYLGNTRYFGTFSYEEDNY